jgi:hypothetical protein
VSLSITIPTITSLGTPLCPYCNAYHAGVCSRIKTIEYWEDGTIKKVELHEPWAPSGGARGVPPS